MSPRPPINIRSKGQRSRSQSHKVQKGDRVAGVSYALYRVLASVVVVVVVVVVVQ